MAIITATSRIKKEVDITDETDMSKFNLCKTHKTKPRILRIFWGRKNEGIVARCGDSYECDVFEGYYQKWNRFNPE